MAKNNAEINVKYNFKKGNQELSSEIKNIKKKYKIVIDTKINNQSMKYLNNTLKTTNKLITESNTNINEYIKSLNTNVSSDLSTELNSVSDALKSAKDNIDLVEFFKDLFIKEREVTIATTGLAASEEVATAATTGLSASFKALSSSSVIGLVLTGVSLAINAYSNYKKKQEEVIKEADELSKTFDASNKTIKNNKSTLEGLQSEYNKLSAGVDDNGKNINLSREKYERYKDIVKQIIDISPSLIKGYNNEGDAIINKNTLLKDAIKLQKELNEENKKEYLTTGSTILEGARNENKKSKKKLKNLTLSGIEIDNSDNLYNLMYKNKIIDMSKNQPTAIRKALSKHGFSYSGIVTSDINALKDIVNNKQEFIKTVASITKLNDVEKQKLSNQIDLIDLQLNKIDTANQKTKKYLTTWSTTKENKSWYNKINPNYLGNYNKQLNKIASNPNKSIEEMQIATRNLGKEFLKIQDKIPTKKIEALKKQLEEGTISNTKFKTSLEKQVKIINDLASKTKNKDISNFLKSIAKDYKNFDSSSLKFQGYVSKINKATSNVTKLTSVNGNKGVGNLNAALKTLSSSLYSNLKNVGKSNNAYLKMYKKAITASIGVKDLALVTDVANKKYKLTSDQVNDLKNKYSGLTDKLIKTKDGWYLEKGAISTVKTAIKKLKKSYAKDVKELTTIIQTESFKRLEAWTGELSQYSTLQEVYYTLSQAMSSTPNGYNQENLDALMEAAKKYFEIQKKINKLFSDNSNDNNSGSSDNPTYGSVTEEKKEFSETIDFKSIKIKSLEKDIANLNAKLANTTTIKGQIDIYNQLIKKQTELSNAYKTTANTYSNKYKKALSILPKAEREKVENGYYKSETFKGKDKKLYKNINKALNLKDKVYNANNNYIESKSKINGYATSLSNVRWNASEKKVEKLNKDIETLNSDLSNTGDYNKKNKILDEILTKTKKIVDEEKKSVKDEKSYVENTYNKIPSNLRVDNKHKKVKLDYKTKISTKNITNQNDLANIKIYNAFIENLIKNTKDLSKANENYNSIKINNTNEKYKNNKAKIDNKISLLENQKQDIQNKLDITNDFQQNADGSYSNSWKKAEFEKQLQISKQEEINYESELDVAQKRLDDVIKKGTDESTSEYKDLADEVQTAKNNLYGCVKTQQELNRSILQLPIDNLKRQNDELQKQLDTTEKQRDNYDKIISAVSDYYDTQIEALEKQKEINEDEDYIDSYANKVKLAEEELKTYQKTNEERQKALELQKAQYDLEKAENQKTKKIYREGQGFVYEADTEAISSAKETLDNLSYEKTVETKQDYIDSLNTQKENITKALDKQIKQLNEYKKQWTDIADTYDKSANIDLLNKYFIGSDWQSKLASGDSSLVDPMKSSYTEADNTVTVLQEKINQNNSLIESAQKIADAWNGTEKTFSDAYNAIQNKVGNTSPELNATQERIDKVTSYSDEWNKATENVAGKDGSLALIEAAQITAKNNEATILNDRLVNLSIYANQAKAIASDVANTINGIGTGLSLSNSALTIKDSTKSPNDYYVNANYDPTILDVNYLHNGMELGYVGSNNSSNDTFKMIALDVLKPDEIPKILRVNEAVITPMQQRNIMSNILSTYKAGILTNTSSLVNTNNTQQSSFSIGEIHLHEVQTINDFANAIVSDFLPTLNQKLYK